MGSITSEGYFIVKRGAFRKIGENLFDKPVSDVMVIAEKYSIVCECGYIIWIENGKIIHALSVAQTDEKSSNFRI